MNISIVALFFLITISLVACDGGSQSSATEIKAFTVNIDDLSINQVNTEASTAIDVSEAALGELTYTF